MSVLYASILDIDGVNNVVFISTCNRTELYLDLDSIRVVDDVLIWWQDNTATSKYDLKDYFFIRQGTDVIKHLMKLSCGLESMVLGEPQILGQVKVSYNISKENNALSKELDRAFQKVFSTAKRVRRETKIGHCPVSVAFSAISLAKAQLDNISSKTVLIIGAGETGELLFKHLEALNPKKIMLANRTIEKADNIVINSSISTSSGLEDIICLANEADIIVVAVSYSGYLLSKIDIEPNKSRVFIDLSIPRVLDPELKDLDNTVYYCVDDINSVIEASMEKRQKEAKRAKKVIIKSLEEYIEKEKTIISNGAIKELFEKADIIIDTSLEKSLARIRNGKDAEDVMKRFAYDVKKKVLHYPVRGMKQASKDGRKDFFDYMKKMFGLS
jgi:glutamyl-tRNA reductase